MLACLCLGPRPPPPPATRTWGTTKYVIPSRRTYIHPNIKQQQQQTQKRKKRKEYKKYTFPINEKAKHKSTHLIQLLLNPPTPNTPKIPPKHPKKHTHEKKDTERAFSCVCVYSHHPI
mmetsp:Transcript_6852/g.12991  ORF Transcript_6852/g.12991 Transcript_6852/m.12991 type:complete len:118 (+) Transcript_6852:1109-1462(+)